MSNPQKAKGCPFKAVVGDMLALPFANEVFDKVVSIFKKTMIPPGRRKLKGKAGCEVFGRFFGCPLGEKLHEEIFLP